MIFQRKELQQFSSKEQMAAENTVLVLFYPAVLLLF